MCGGRRGPAIRRGGTEINNKFTDFIEKAQNITEGVTQVLSNFKNKTDNVLGAIIDAGMKFAKEKLEDFNKQWRVNFLRTCCFDAVFIAVAAVCIIIHAPWARPVLWGTGALKLLWTLWRGIALYKNVQPYKETIKRFAPVTLGDLWKTRSIRKTLDNAIRNIFRYYYGGKLNTAVQTIHAIAAKTGAVSSANEVEDKVVEKVYPPLNSFIRQTLFVNVLCFIVFYGIFIMLVKMCLMRLV